MGNLTVAVTFVWILNILMFMTQAAVVNLSPTNSTTFYNCSGSILQGYSAPGQDCMQIVVPDTNSFTNSLPIASKNVEETSGLGFIDAISTARNWITEKIEYFIAVLSGPYAVLKSIPGLPPVFVSAIALLWYSISIILLAAFIVGRDA